MGTESDLLKIGCAVGDITPSARIPLAGFAFRKAPYEKIDHRLKLKVAVFSQADGKSALLVVADLLWWDPQFVDYCRDLIADRFEIPREAQIFSATHTHSAPMSGSTFAATLGAADKKYLKILEKQLLLLVRQAKKDAEPVWTVSRGSSKCIIGINRRKKTAEGIQMAPNPEGYVDREVLTFDFRKEDGSLKMSLCHFGCHPTVKADLSISSEYCGVAMDDLEKITGAPAFFLLGCCAEIRPDLQKNGAFYRGGAKEVERLAAGLLKSVVKARRAGKTSRVKSHIQYRATEIELRFQRRYSQHILAKVERGDFEKLPKYFRAFPADTLQTWARTMQNKLPSPPKLEMTLVSVATEITFLAMSGEMASAYGLFAKSLAQGVVPITCCNGMSGYIPTDEFIQEGGYEGGEAHILFLYPNAFRPGLETRIKRGMSVVVQEDRSSR